MNHPRNCLTASIRALCAAWKHALAQQLLGILSSEANLPPATATAEIDWTQREVLVGSLRNPAQFSICLKKQLYYIPADLVPEEMLPVRYVALFRTPRIFGSSAGIQYYGAVSSTSLVRRSVIRAVPLREGADPNALYYLFRIQQWHRLPRMIAPKESAFVSEFTNLFLLQNAEYVPELLLQSEEEYQIYSQLKQWVIDASVTEHPAPADLEVGDCRILLTEAEIQLEKGGTVLDRFSLREFSQRPYGVFRRMMMLAGK